MRVYLIYIVHTIKGCIVLSISIYINVMMMHCICLLIVCLCVCVCVCVVLAYFDIHLSIKYIIIIIKGRIIIE